MNTHTSNKLDIIVRSKWKSADLSIICALLNTTGGEIIYKINQEAERSAEQLEKLIHKKIKKIKPDPQDSLRISCTKEQMQQIVTIYISSSSSVYYVLTRKKDKIFYYKDGKQIIKTSEEIIKRTKNGTPKKTTITKLTSMMKIPDTEFVTNHTFLSGNSVPIFEAFSVYGFNRIVGYLKYINRTYANVYSRGECKLHNSLIPSLYRNATNIESENRKITTIVNRFFSDNTLVNYLALDVMNKVCSQYRIEGLLQHYGATTSFLDVVDNHWIALWMGLNQYVTTEQIDKYATYIERTIPLIEKISGDTKLQEKNVWEEKIYQYVLLVAVPFPTSPTTDGINITNDIIEVDLRTALPSTFVRPHAQHGLVIKKNIQEHQNTSQDYDVSTNVVAIIKIRIDRAKKWIGDGTLLTKDNLIPPPGYDPGYDLLLSKQATIFKRSLLKITKYM